jgi:small-conductance mechanosensitive channel
LVLDALFLDFVKSADSVYKEARLLRASVRNSEKIDRAFEKAINIAFYVCMACVILGQIGFNPLTLFVSLSSVVLAFAFSKSASPYFTG